MNINRLFIAFALILFFCAGCATISLGYNYADWLLRYWINDYTTFSASQEEQIHREVDSYLRWHRKEALPGYIAFLQHVDTAVNREGGLTVSDVISLRDEFNAQYQLTMMPMIGPAAHILSTVDSRQITELANTFAERNRKQRKKLLSGSEQEILDIRAERHVEFVEKLVGNLSTEQKNKITEMSLLAPFATRAYLGQREAKQASLIALLKGKANEDRIAELFRQWLTRPEDFRTPEQQQIIASYEGAMSEMTVRILGMLTTRQKQHLNEEIATYIKDFRKLNASSENAGATDERLRENAPEKYAMPL